MHPPGTKVENKEKICIKLGCQLSDIAEILPDD